MPRRFTISPISPVGHPSRFLARVLMRMQREEIEAATRRSSRKRPPGMAPAMAEPPRGPLPMQGGAAAPLEFDAD